MATRSLPKNQSGQQKGTPVSYIPVGHAPMQYIFTQPSQEYYIAPEMYQSWNRPPATFQVPVPSAYGQQCFMLVQDNMTGVPHGGMSPGDHQQYVTMRMGSAPQNVLMAPAQWNYQTHIPDARLNPNSREFVKNSAGTMEKYASPSPNPEQPRDAVSLPRSNTHSRNPSSDGSETGITSKLHSLNLRYHSGDSGIAETSSSSATWSSDDDVDSVMSPASQERLSPDEIKERLWTMWDDEKYWRNMRRFRPGDALCSAIVKQIEFYMSDEYLAKDKYLLRQIRCKRDGYVSIKLMTSFKKMKKLAQDWPVLRCAITRMSNTLVVSGEGLRIRRKQQLSEELRKPRMLTSVLAIRLPETYNAVDRVTSLLRVFGEIGLVRLLRPDRPVPVDLRNYATQVPDIGVSLCAVVEFESATDALSAVRVLKNRNRECSAESPEQDQEDPDNKSSKEAEMSEEDMSRLRKITEEMPDLVDMRLALLGPRVRRTLYRQDRNKSDETSSNSSIQGIPPSGENQVASKAPVKVTSSTTVDNCVSWRKNRPLATILRSPTKLINVIRQPHGAHETKGFQFRRNLGL